MNTGVFVHETPRGNVIGIHEQLSAPRSPGRLNILKEGNRRRAPTTASRNNTEQRCGRLVVAAAVALPFLSFCRAGFLCLARYSCNGLRRAPLDIRRRDIPKTRARHRRRRRRSVLLRTIKSQSRVNLPDRLFKTFMPVDLYFYTRSTTHGDGGRETNIGFFFFLRG